ncbi:alpha/beta fold hydrolase [Mycolicibacterium celeriflavum]|uniref:alpha/beta fold hydrolase n=1 Tax=Mycolicibacterium celeriflavum TaxID=1249101 RepID=UPI003CE9893B
MTTELTAPDGTRLVVEVAGGGPPVLFVHGTGGGLATWADVGSRLVGHRVAHYARRNHAPSDVGPSPNSFAVEAADLRVVLGHLTDLSGHPVHVVGGSYGASVALHAAAESAEGIASLALFEPPVLLVGGHLLPVLKQFQQLCAAGQFDGALDIFAREVARIPAEVIAAAPPPESDPETSRRATTAVRADLEGMAADTADTERWASINVPVLLMQGGQSWAPLPEGMDRLADALPHAQRVYWPDQSHFAIAAAPARVAEAIQGFIDSADFAAARP